MNKQKLISIGIILLLAGLGGYKWWEYKHPEIVQTSISGGNPANAASNTNIADNTKLPSKTLNIITDVPINGAYKGVIEVGASGFNAFVINMDKDKNWELVTKEFGASLAYEGFATTEDVYIQMKKYISIITDKGVAGRNIHFVISSGALKSPKLGLIAEAIQKKGFTVNKVTAEQEGKYALKALLPKSYRSNSFTIDIGSGNTKVSWMTGDKMTSLEGEGAKYFQDGKNDGDVYNNIRSLISQIPEANRKNCFIIGGVPFKLASQSRNGNERYTALLNPDEYSAGDDVKVKSGLNIYRAIYENSHCENFIFDWDANFTVGFLLTLN